MRNRLVLPPDTLPLLEVSLMGLFFIQSLRYLVGAVYSGYASASLVAVLDPAMIPAGTPGAVHPIALGNQLSFLLYMLALPLAALLLGRFRLLLVAAVALVGAGRALMFAGTPLLTPLTGGALVLGSGLFYLALLARHRPHLFPYFFIVGLGADQMFRAFGNTLDPSWSLSYLPVQYVLTGVAIVLAFLALRLEGRRGDDTPPAGVLPLWGGVAIGGLLFLQLALLALPNAIAGRSGSDYTLLVPFTLAATLLPCIPSVRTTARSLIAPFDGGVRGWLWALLVAILLVFGTRIAPALMGAGLPIRLSTIIAAGALLLAQFCVCLMWFWLVRPRGEKERGFEGLWLILGLLLFALLAFCDVFTYEYAFVRSTELDLLNRTLIPLLRGFRGMGVAVLLIALLFAATPMIQTTRRIPWAGAGGGLTLLTALCVAGAALLAAYFARPPVIVGVRNVDSIRVGTYNIHNGFSEFFAFDLEALAQTIQKGGADVVLMQEVDAGRMTSFGVDQTLWLARRLGMDRRYFPTNEGLNGLAVLSRVEIVFDDGYLLAGTGKQTGVQRVQVRPDAGVVTLYNTWLGLLLDIPGRPLTDQEQDQQRQLDQIFGIIASHHPDGILGRTVIAGTFNNVPDSPLIDRMRTVGFRDPLDGLPVELSATLRRTTQIARLDYLWLRNLTALGWLIIDGAASDHRLVVVEVVLTR